MKKINRKNLTIALFLLSLPVVVQAQTPVPAGKQTTSILLSGGTVHVGNGKVIEKGLIGIRSGKIDLVSDAATTQLKEGAYDTIIYLNQQQVYPAFIAPNSTLGLNEVESVRATHDYREVGGAFNPHIRSLIAFNTDSKVATTVRTNGVLYIQATPREGVISGTSSIFALEGWNWEDAVLKKDDGIHLNFPKSAKRVSRRAEPQASPLNDKFEEELNEIKKFFTDAKAYNLSKIKEEKNLRYEAMKGLFDGSQKLYIHADNAKDIMLAVNFSKQMEIKNCVLVGGKEAWKVTQLLRQNNIPVMLSRVHDLPDREQEDVDLPYKLPFLLQKDSVQFCLQNAGDMEAMNARNLPFLAGTACAYGLSKEQALSAITLNTAIILGVDKQIGSIEVGKQASIIISTGDALDMRTNNIEMAFVDGKKIMLINTQQELYKKYMNKYQLNK